ncbi:ferric reductase-like transmembrane domain-containing protein [Paraconexibacter antarcticus]|uniref:Ferric reductase-like transmembrane domain-containing protein n=1 Tax=Paraconexibacter antarcticus TaxID=2949664 RepID=A0ABY5DM15_9ACTN|nr:ferric reductase-like transmembrane domain-containing protein [Paraconexibacter antarcticus]UTI62960.1 ferric reductase-like transmembrane domain-containing protein [Paraconexibacter antarcticus]
MILAAAHGPSPLWYASRGAGAMLLVLLTVSTVLGVAEVRGLHARGLPRFTVAALHRSASLGALVLLVVHIVTVLLDPFPKFGLLTAVVPFAGSYRPLWVGLGTLAADLLVVLVVTSVVRARLGYGAWRAIHVAAVVCWPAAVLHGLGTGSDAQAAWMQALTAACVLAVLGAVAVRVAHPGLPRAVRAGLPVAALLAVGATVVWAQQGPFARGWARRAGTPESVLAAFSGPRPPAALARRARGRASSRPRPTPAPAPFDVPLAGTLRTGPSSSGEQVVDLRLRLHDAADRRLRVRIAGSAAENGGIVMSRSAVTFGPAVAPTRFRGRLEQLDGNHLETVVGDAAGAVLRLRVVVSVDGSGHVAGQVTGSPVR